MAVPATGRIRSKDRARIEIHQRKSIRLLHGSDRMPSVWKEQRGMGPGTRTQVDARIDAGSGHIDQHDMAAVIVLGAVLPRERLASVGRNGDLVGNDRTDGDSRYLRPGRQIDERNAAARAVGDDQRAVLRKGGQAPEPQHQSDA